MSEIYSGLGAKKLWDKMRGKDDDKDDAPVETPKEPSALEQMVASQDMKRERIRKHRRSRATVLDPVTEDSIG